MQPLSYLGTTGGMIWTAACVLSGILLTWLSYFIINRIPAAWLCDYGETPSPELLSGRRVKYAGSGIVMSIITAVCLVLCRLQFNKGFTIYFVLLSLIIILSLMIAVCDIKYTIIPDQFTAALAVLCILVSVYDIVRGFGILHKSWWSPIAGAAIGAGVMIAIDIIGMIIYKKTGMGFGDVKLFAAIGILTGFPGTFLALAISLVTATVCFCFIIVLVRIISRRSAPDENADAAETFAAEHEDAKENAGVTSAQTVTAEADEKEDQKEDQTDQDPQQETGGGSYLAFGPYIAIATVCYIVFYDFIYDMFELYMSNFK